MFQEQAAIPHFLRNTDLQWDCAFIATAPGFPEPSILEPIKCNYVEGGKN